MYIAITTTQSYSPNGTDIYDAVLAGVVTLNEVEATITTDCGSNDYVKIIAKGQSIHIISHSIKVKDNYIHCATFEETARTFIAKCKEMRDA